MGIFLPLLLIPMAMQHIAIKGIHSDYQKRNRAALAFFFIGITALVMLRHKTVGNDTANYIYYFSVFSRADWNQISGIGLEIGYGVFVKLITLITDDPQVFLAIAAITVTLMIYPVYRRLCTDVSLTILLFCTMSTFVMLFSGMRQMLAVGAGCLAYTFTRKRKLIPFILMVLLAISFHTSAFMLAVMYPLYHAKITKKWLFVLVPVLIVCFIFNKPIFAALALILERYTAYDAEIASTGAYMMLVLFGAFTVFSYVIPDESQMDDETIGLRNFLLLSFAIQMFAPLHTLAMRMNYYYIIFIPLLLPKIIQFKNKRWSQVATLGRYVMVVFFFLYFFYNASTSENLHVFPYHFFWETV